MRKRHCLRRNGIPAFRRRPGKSGKECKTSRSCHRLCAASFLGFSMAINIWMGVGLHYSGIVPFPTNGTSVYEHGIPAISHHQGLEGFQPDPEPSTGPNGPELVNPDNIPAFMKEYFRWHGKQLSRIQKDAVVYDDGDFLKNYRFLVLRCVDNDRCGGLSDRLKGFPLFLWYAATTDRILLIRWGDNRPAPIETFLRPGAFWNWTVPDVLSRKLLDLDRASGLDSADDDSIDLRDYPRFYFDGTEKKQALADKLKSRSLWMGEGNHYNGERAYSRFVGAALAVKKPQRFSPSSFVSFSDLGPRDADFGNFYHDLFHATFRPSAGVAKSLNSYFYDPVRNHNREADVVPGSRLPVPLQPNRYAVAQFRAAYPGEPYETNQNTRVLRDTTVHAIECARTRVGTSDVYVMSDTGLAIEAAHDAYRNKNTASTRVWTPLDLVTREEITGETKPSVPAAEDPPHLNFARPEDVSAFYVVFADLFLMSYARCVVYGAGGFGRLGSLVSYEPLCGTEFTANQGVLQDCEPFKKEERLRFASSLR